MGTYGGSHMGAAGGAAAQQQHTGSSVYGGAHMGAAAANSSSMRTHANDNLLLSQSGVSHSALVNSGNAAILGHHQTFKLNSNNNNLVGVGGGGPATLGSTYGALGNPNGIN